MSAATGRHRRPVTPPRVGSVRAALLATLPADGSPIERAELVAGIRALRPHTATSTLGPLLTDELGGPTPMLIREMRAGLRFYRRSPAWISAPPEPVAGMSCSRCGGEIVSTPRERRCRHHGGPG